jgi:hypothetical protein
MNVIEKLTDEQRKFINKLTCVPFQDKWQLYKGGNPGDLCIYQPTETASNICVIFHRYPKEPTDVIECLFDYDGNMIEVETFSLALFRDEDDMIERVNTYFTV